jgi:adenylate cyclase
MRFVKGNNEVLLDEEGSVFYSLPRESSHTFYSMALELALMYWGLDERAIHYRTTRLKIMDSAGKVYAQIPMANRQVVELNWFSRWKNDKLNPRCSLVDLFEQAREYYEGTAEERKAAEVFFDQMHGAIVLVGQVDPSLYDLSPTPFDRYPVPNVGVQGNLIKTIISGLFIKRPPVWGTILIIALSTASLTGIVLYRGPNSVIYDTVVVVLFLSYLVFVFIAFDVWHLVLPVVAPVGAAVTTMVAALAMRIIDYEKQKHRMKGLFGTYVSPDLVNRMIERREEPRLGGVEENITAFFSDIEQFTTLSELLRPPELVSLINDYLDAMTSIIKTNGGTLDKYIGDAIVAMFGAPFAIHDHPRHACRAAIEMHARQAELCQKWTKDKVFAWPDLVLNMRTRIGINTGFATVGNMGSTTRFNYTMMGDTVNLAARAEQVAKVYGARTVLTEATVMPASEQDECLVFRFLDDVLVPGRTKPVKVYDLIGYKDEIPTTFWDCLEVFEQGRVEYLKQNWLGAYALFEKAALLEFTGPTPRDPMRINPSRVFMDRCRKMNEHPPAPAWTGVYEVRIKQ